MFLNCKSVPVAQSDTEEILPVEESIEGEVMEKGNSEDLHEGE